METLYVIIFVFLNLAKGSVEAKQCGNQADVMIVIDSSRSIWPPHFKDQLEFVQEIVKMFGVGHDSTRVAALTFSHNVSKEFDFNAFDTADEVVERYKEETIQEATLAKQQGIKILAIGIGNEVNDAELEAVVTPPAKSNYFKSSFDELKSEDFQELVGQQACKEGVPEDSPVQTCQGKEADVVIVMDKSTSISVEQFKEQKIFLADLISHFDIDSGKTRVGMVAFSTNAEVQFYLNEFTTSEEISKAILAVETNGGDTFTHLALQKLLNEMLTSQHGSRPSVAHICIIITDGGSTYPRLTESQAQLVHDSGVYVFAIGVGNMTDKAELKLLSSKPEFVFEVNGYSALPTIQALLASKTCKVPQAKELSMYFSNYSLLAED